MRLPDKPSATQVFGIILLLTACTATTLPPETTVGDEAATTSTAAPTPTTVTSAPVTSTTSLDDTTVLFDGVDCEISGPTVLPSGIVRIYLHNTFSNASEALLGKLDSGVDWFAVEALVQAGSFDEFGLTDWSPPQGVSSTPLRMPPNSTESIRQSFAAEPGTWVVICLDIVENQAFIAEGTLETS